ncbi:MAG: hypothetical protein IT172_02255 [Acidobacteria bacterium]|nr:hypothetical protein [Acidobacteriota bacterium]
MKLCNLHTLIFALSFAILAPAAMLAQTKADRPFSVAATNDGLTIHYTAATPQFRLTVAEKGLSITRKAEDGVTLNSAGGSMMIRFTKTAEFADTSKTLADQEILEAHRQWFNWMRAAESGKKIKVTDGPAGSLSVTDLRRAGKVRISIPSLSWTAKSAGRNANLFYRTALIGNVVVMLGASFDGNKAVMASAVTKRALESLTIIAGVSQKKGDEIDEFLEMAEANGVSRADLKRSAEEFEKTAASSKGSVSAAKAATKDQTVNEALRQQRDILSRELPFIERFGAFKKAYQERFESPAGIRQRRLDGDKSFIYGAELKRFQEMKRETAAFLAEFREYLLKNERILKADGKQAAIDGAKNEISRLDRNLEWLNGELKNYSSN